MGVEGLRSAKGRTGRGAGHKADVRGCVGAEGDRARDVASAATTIQRVVRGARAREEACRRREEVSSGSPFDPD